MARRGQQAARGPAYRREPAGRELEHPYSREEAAYPLGKNYRPKVWPPVRCIDGAYGDRNLVFRAHR